MIKLALIAIFFIFASNASQHRIKYSATQMRSLKPRIIIIPKKKNKKKYHVPHNSIEHHPISKTIILEHVEFKVGAVEKGK